MSTQESAALGRLYKLLDGFRAGDLDARAFCSAFERNYNLELDKTELSPREALAFSELFEKVVWFSPYSEERRRIPNYLSEEDIAEAIDRACLQLRSDEAE